MGKIAVVVAILILAVALALIFWPREEPPAPQPGPGPAPAGASAIHDAEEDLIFALDLAVNQQRLALAQLALTASLEAFDDGFEGDAIFGGGERTTSLERPWLRVQKRGAAPSKREELARQWREFFHDVLTVVSSRHKVSKGREAGADAAHATTVMELEVATAAGRVTFTDTYETDFVRRDERWRIAKQSRTDGRIVEGRGAGLTRAWAADVGPGVGSHSEAYRTPLLHLGGLAAGDYDGDGRIDLFVQRIGEPALLRNEGGGRFRDVTEEAGLAFESIGSGALWLDHDNDGRLDLVTTALCAREHCEAGCGVRLWHNDGRGRFENWTDRCGLRARGQCYSACAADVDRDGRLDLFVARYGSPQENELSYGPSGGSWIDSRDAEPDLLFVAQPDGTYRECAKERGVADSGWGLAAAFFDMDDDDAPDLFVANDFGPDRLYHNQGNGGFKEATPAEVAGAGFGMGVTPVDFDGDGALDLYVSEMYSTAGNRVLDKASDLPAGLLEKLRRGARGNTMLRGDGGRLVDATGGSGAQKAGWAWGAAAFELDNDGRADLYVANGFMSGRSRLDL